MLVEYDATDVHRLLESPDGAKCSVIIRGSYSSAVNSSVKYADSSLSKDFTASELEKFAPIPEERSLSQGSV